MQKVDSGRNSHQETLITSETIIDLCQNTSLKPSQAHALLKKILQNKRDEIIKLQAEIESSNENHLTMKHEMENNKTHIKLKINTYQITCFTCIKNIEKIDFHNREIYLSKNNIVYKLEVSDTLPIAGNNIKALMRNSKKIILSEIIELCDGVVSFQNHPKMIKTLTEEAQNDHHLKKTHTKYGIFCCTALKYEQILSGATTIKINTLPEEQLTDKDKLKDIIQFFFNTLENAQLMLSNELHLEQTTKQRTTLNINIEECSKTTHKTLKKYESALKGVKTINLSNLEGHDRKIDDNLVEQIFSQFPEVTIKFGMFSITSKKSQETKEINTFTFISLNKISYTLSYDATALSKNEMIGILVKKYKNILLRAQTLTVENLKDTPYDDIVKLLPNIKTIQDAKGNTQEAHSIRRSIFDRLASMLKRTKHKTQHNTKKRDETDQSNTDLQVSITDQLKNPGTTDGAGYETDGDRRTKQRVKQHIHHTCDRSGYETDGDRRTKQRVKQHIHHTCDRSGYETDGAGYPTDKLGHRRKRSSKTGNTDSEDPHTTSSKPSTNFHLQQVHARQNGDPTIKYTPFGDL